MGEIMAEERRDVYGGGRRECFFRVPCRGVKISVFCAAGRGETMLCPECCGANCYRSHRDGIMDLISSVVGLRPWRCHTCEHRFQAWRVAASFEQYVHCPQCGNFDLEHISRERVDQGTMLLAKRWLGFPAYRCDPCRRRFFSARQFKRILPVMTETQPRKATTS